MNRLQRMAEIQRSPAGQGETGFRISPVFDCDLAAGALSDFLEETRSILARIEESYTQGEEARPTEKARRDILRRLAVASEEVEFHDLPRASGFGAHMGRSLVADMAKDGLVESVRNKTYPNMVYLKITEAGRKELRQIGVREAMAWLHEDEREVSHGLRKATAALRKLVETVCVPPHEHSRRRTEGKGLTP